MIVRRQKHETRKLSITSATQRGPDLQDPQPLNLRVVNATVPGVLRP